MTALRYLLIAGAICLPLAGGACGAGGGSGGAPTNEATTTVQTASNRCKDVPRALVKLIETRLTARETLRNARAVKSRDLKQVWFISAEIDGPGLEVAGDIGTWAKSGPLAVGGGRILSVDSVFAQQLSAWAPGDTTYVGVTMDDDGAQESHDCVARG